VHQLFRGHALKYWLPLDQDGSETANYPYSLPQQQIAHYLCAALFIVPARQLLQGRTNLE